MSVTNGKKLTLSDISQQMGINLSQSEIANDAIGEESNATEHTPDLTEHPSDSQPIARKPQLKFILILLAVSGVVGLFSLFMLGGNVPSEVASPPSPSPSPFVDDKEAEIAQLQSKLSMEDQKRALEGNSPNKPIVAPTSSPTVSPSPPGVVPPDAVAATPNPVPSSTLPPSVRTVRPLPPNTRRQEEVVTRENYNYRASGAGSNASNYVATSPSVGRRTYSSRSPANYPSPVSYRPDTSASFSQPSYRPNPTRSPTSNAVNARSRERDVILAKQQQEISALKERLAGIEAQKKVQPVSAPSPSTQENVSTKTQSDSTSAGDSVRSVPTIEPVESEAVVANRTPPPSIPIPVLAVGSRIKGTLISPLQVSQEQSSSNSSGIHQIFVKTSEPILTYQNWQVPAGAIVAIDATVAPNGLVTGQSQGVWYGNHPVKIPVGAMSLGSSDDDPLVAKAIEPASKAIARAENEAMLWSAVGQVGETLTQPQSQVSISNGGVVTTAVNNAKPSLIGAVLKGAFNTKAEARKQAAQSKRDAALQQAPIWQLSRGTEVTLIANAPQVDPSLIASQVLSDTVQEQSFVSPLSEEASTPISNVPESNPEVSTESDTYINIEANSLELASNAELDSQQPPEAEPMEVAPADENNSEKLVPKTPVSSNTEVDSQLISEEEPMEVVPADENDCIDDSWGIRSYPHVTCDINN